jgi:hypothetical protein
MPPILDASARGPMPGERCFWTDVILPVQLNREKIPVNFLLFTGRPRSALPSVVIANEGQGRLLRDPLDSTDSCPNSNEQPFLTFPQTKPTSANEANGETLMKTMFEHEQHHAWPTDPDSMRRRRAFWPNEPNTRFQYAL